MWSDLWALWGTIATIVSLGLLAWMVVTNRPDGRGRFFVASMLGPIAATLVIVLAVAAV